MFFSIPQNILWKETHLIIRRIHFRWFADKIIVQIDRTGN